MKHQNIIIQSNYSSIQDVLTLPSNSPLKLPISLPVCLFFKTSPRVNGSCENMHEKTKVKRSFLFEMLLHTDSS